MRQGRFLPLAPRPLDGELMSSWQERVASRYGRAVVELEHCLDPRSPGIEAGFVGRDFRPDPTMIALWARACRLSGSSIARTTLGLDLRPLHWHVLDPARPAVCPACLEEDLAHGRDHFRRRSWALAETLVCPSHHTMLMDTCRHCHSLSGFQQHWAAGRGHLRCRACSATVSGRKNEPMRSEWTAFLLRLTQTISKHIDAATSVASDIDAAVELLWSPSPGGRRPFIRWLTFARRSGEGMPADRMMPLATASLRWRVATLIGAAQLLDLADARDQFGEPAGFILDAFAARRRITVARPSPRPVEITPAPRPLEPIRDRSDADYAGMARAILASPEWLKGQGSDRSRRDRLLGRLMAQALDQAPLTPAGAPGPVAP